MSDIVSIVQNYPYQLEAAYVLHEYNAHEAVGRYPNTVGGFTLNNLANQAERIDFAAGQICTRTTASVARIFDVAAAEVVLAAQTNSPLGNAYDRYLDELSIPLTPAVLREHRITDHGPEQQLIVDALGGSARPTSINNCFTASRHKQHSTYHSKVCRKLRNTSKGC